MKTTLVSIVLLAGFIGGGKLLQQAGVFFSEENYQQSTTLYLEALNAYPNQVSSIHYNLGLCYLRQDSLLEAMRHFRAAIHPRDPEVSAMAANEIGILLVNMEQDRDALQSFKEALIYDPDFELARYNYELLIRQIDPPNQEDDSPSFDDPDPDDNFPPEDVPPSNELSAETQAILAAFEARQLGDGGSDGALTTPPDTLTSEAAQVFLKELKSREVQFLQQMVKTAKLPPRKTQRPDW